MTSLTRAIAIAAAAAGPAAGLAAGQMLTPEWPQLRRVEEGIGDAGPMSRSLRVVAPDPRLDTDWDHVYSVPGAGGYFARRDNGVTAVFPRSNYSRSGRAEAPADTLFVIGVPPAWVLDRMGTAEKPVEVAGGVGPAVRPRVPEDMTPAPMAHAAAERPPSGVLTLPMASDSPRMRERRRARAAALLEAAATSSL